MVIHEIGNGRISIASPVMPMLKSLVPQLLGLNLAESSVAC